MKTRGPFERRMHVTCSNRQKKCMMARWRGSATMGQLLYSESIAMRRPQIMHPTTTRDKIDLILDLFFNFELNLQSFAQFRGWCEVGKVFSSRMVVEICPNMVWRPKLLPGE